METNTMTAILEGVGAFFSEAITWLGDVCSTIVSEPLLLIMVLGVTLTGFAVGLTRRLFKF